MTLQHALELFSDAEERAPLDMAQIWKQKADALIAKSNLPKEGKCK